jgi:adenosyl cobinamide kinase/adenosyl cobinamide phosphate guanylyltransferase
MKQQISVEQIVFFATAKAVRNEQEHRKEMHEIYKDTDHWDVMKAKYAKQSLYIHVSDNTVWSIANDMAFSMDYMLTYKQFWAVFYKLQTMEMVKIHKGNSKRTTKLGLGKKGVEYVKNIKLKAAN